MTITRYRLHVACLLVGLIVGIGGASVFGLHDHRSRGLAAEGCVHITTTATVCGGDAKRFCNRTAVRVAAIEFAVGDAVTQMQALQTVECRKV